MPVEIDLDQLPPFPKRIPEKLRAIRERLKLTQDEIARRVGARNGAEIEAYESDEDDLLVPVLWGWFPYNASVPSRMRHSGAVSRFERL